MTCGGVSDFMITGGRRPVSLVYDTELAYNWIACCWLLQLKLSFFCSCFASKFEAPGSKPHPWSLRTPYLVMPLYQLAHIRIAGQWRRRSVASDHIGSKIPTIVCLLCQFHYRSATVRSCTSLKLPLNQVLTLVSGFWSTRVLVEAAAWSFYFVVKSQLEALVMEEDNGTRTLTHQTEVHMFVVIHIGQDPILDCLKANLATVASGWICKGTAFWHRNM